jgi:hypothetical protein
MFSTYGKMKKHANVHDLAQLIEALMHAFTNPVKRPGFLFIADVLNWDKWLAPARGPLYGHNTPYVAHLLRDPKTGLVSLEYKVGSNDADWMGMDPKNSSLPLAINKGGLRVPVLTSIPSGTPEWCERNLPVPDELRRGIANCSDFISSASAAWLSGILEGDTGIAMDAQLLPGQFGAAATIQCGTTAQQLQVIGPQLDLKDMFKLPHVDHPDVRFVGLGAANPVRIVLPKQRFVHVANKPIRAQAGAAKGRSKRGELRLSPPRRSGLRLPAEKKASSSNATGAQEKKSRAKKARRPSSDARPEPMDTSVDGAGGDGTRTLRSQVRAVQQALE